MIPTRKLINCVTLSLSLCALIFGGIAHAEEDASIGTTASVGFSGAYEEKDPPAIDPEGNGNGNYPGGSGSGNRPNGSGSISRPNGSGGGTSGGSTSRYPSSGSSSSNGSVLPKLGNISQTIYSSYGIILMGIMSIFIYKENKNEKEIL